MEQGSIEQRIGNLDARISHLEDGQEAVEKRLEQILEILTSAKGGWRVLVAIGAVVTGIAMIVNAASSAVHWFTGR